MEQSTQKEEVKYGVNKAHIHGYIDSLVVFKNEGGNQHAALANVTSFGDTYTNKEGKQIKERDHHRVKILITDAELSAYEQIAADCKEKAANKGVDGFEPKNHTITLDNARMVNEDRKFDKDSDEVRRRAEERMYNSALSIAEANAHSPMYTGMTNKGNGLSASPIEAKYVLLPVYTFNVKHKGQTYSFAMNGQTGKVVGDVPTDSGRSLLRRWGTFAAVFAAAMLVLSLISC